MATKNSIKILVIMVIIIALASCASLQVASVPPTWPLPEGVKTVDVNGYPMAYQDKGSGIPLLLIHGSFQDYRTWEFQTPDLSKAYRTIAVSLRHYYPEKWDGIGGDFSIDQHASDVAGLIKKLDLGKVHLLGWSRGGSIALTVASLYPEVIRTLILEDANMEPLMPETSEKQKRMAMAKASGEKVRINLASDGPEKAALELIGGPGAWEKTPPKARQMTLDNIGTGTDNGDRGKFTCADIQKFNFPILLLTGEKSPKVYGEFIDVMKKCKADISNPLIVPKGTHYMHRVNPEFFNKAILDFLKQY